MKKYQRRLPMLALLMLLSGCTAQTVENVPPVLNTTTPPEISAVMESEPETEETIPVREPAKAVDTASAPEPTVSIETESKNKWESRNQGELSATAPEETAPSVPEIPVTEPPKSESQAEELAVTMQPETQIPDSQPTESLPAETIPLETEPPASGDIYSAGEAMAVGNNYAVTAYGMCADSSLGFGNSSYEFADTAYVSGLNWLGGQNYLNQMVKAKVDSLVRNLTGAYGADFPIAGTRVNCYVEYDPSGNLYWIYVFYG